MLGVDVSIRSRDASPPVPVCEVTMRLKKVDGNGSGGVANGRSAWTLCVSSIFLASLRGGDLGIGGGQKPHVARCPRGRPDGVEIVPNGREALIA